MAQAASWEEPAPEVERSPGRSWALPGSLLLTVVIALVVLLWSGRLPFNLERFLSGTVDRQSSAFLLPVPLEKRQALTEQQRQQLEGYGWVNQETGMVHIPLERAMSFIVEQGLPTRRPAPETVSDAAAPAESDSEAMAAAGEALFQDFRCTGCHPPGEGTIGPSLVGVFGASVELESGETITADEAYLRRSILQPHLEIVAGYPPVMPAFQEQVNEEQLAQLLAYMRSLQDEK